MYVPRHSIDLKPTRVDPSRVDLTRDPKSSPGPNEVRSRDLGPTSSLPINPVRKKYRLQSLGSPYIP